MGKYLKNIKFYSKISILPVESTLRPSLLGGIKGRLLKLLVVVNFGSESKSTSLLKVPLIVSMFMVDTINVIQ